MAACAARIRSSSSSRSVKPPPALLLARKITPSTSCPAPSAAPAASPSRIGMPRKACMSGCADGQPPNAGARRTSASRVGPDFCSIAASTPCWRGSGPIARHCSSVMPSTTNCAKPPWSSGTPRAAYSAPSRLRAEAVIRRSTSRTSRCRLIARTALLTASIPPRQGSQDGAGAAAPASSSASAGAAGAAGSSVDAGGIPPTYRRAAGRTSVRGPAGRRSADLGPRRTAPAQDADGRPSPVGRAARTRRWAGPVSPGA